ncbi:hypothetical protein ASD52_24990 [Ensifer sp. Root142]|nr:hypothetical protein ASD52_24990 [Ensifer sp. Root142]
MLTIRTASLGIGFAPEWTLDLPNRNFELRKVRGITLTVALQPSGALLVAEAYSPQDALNWFGVKAANAANRVPECLEQFSPHSYAAAGKELHFLRHPEAPGRLYAHDGMRATPKTTRFWL